MFLLEEIHAQGKICDLIESIEYYVLLVFEEMIK